MNKRVSLSLILITGMLFMSSCLNPQVFTNSRTRLLDFYSSSEKGKADKTFEEVLETVQNKDKEGLMAMFSQQALDQAENLDQNIDFLFNFFKGEVLSTERTGPIVSETNSYGVKTKELKTWYDVDTENQKYLFFFLENPVDTENPNNIGLYSLRVIKAEDEETEFTYWQDMKIPGIYVPEKYMEQIKSE